MHQEQRQAVRIQCDLPVRIHGLDGPITAHLVDISRTGIRIRIPGPVLRVHRLSSLAQIAGRLTEGLGEAFAGELHPDLLGSLIRKRLTPTRIAKRDWERTDVEVGCTLDSPLSDVEVGMLGLALPPIGDRRARSREEVHAPSTRPGRSPSRSAPAESPSYQAFIYPAAGKSARPLLTRTKTVSRGMAFLEIERLAGWSFDKMDVNELVVALDDAYGSDILLRIVDDGRDLWAGPAEIKDVDVGEQTSAIRLGVSFGRELRAEELGRLGVPAPA
jgi:hypothetical protein